MALHGYAKLMVKRNNRIIDQVEHHNVLTNFPQNVMRAGNFNGLVLNSKVQPAANNFFSGVYLTDKVNPNGDNVSGFFGMIGSDSEITALAGNDAYTGNNYKRGSANLSAAATGPITNGYRWTWDWSELYGNGPIASVCLTRPELAKLHFIESGTFDYEDDPTLAKTYANEGLNSRTQYMSESFRDLTIIDYEKERGFKVWAEVVDGQLSIKCEEYALNTKGVHLVGGVLDVIEKIGATHTVFEGATSDSYSLASTTVIYTGDKIHFVRFTYNTGRLICYVIDPSDWAAAPVVYDRNYEGVKLADFRGTFASYHVIEKDGMWIEYENGAPYIYAIAKTTISQEETTVIIKLDLVNPLGVATVVAECPYSTCYNGPWLGLPNGDRFKADRDINSEEALWWHNNKFYKTNIRNYAIQGSLLQGFDGCATYGTNIVKFDENRGQPQYRLLSLDAFFGWVSTVNNLSRAITKNASMTMSLVYEITES